MVFQVSKSLVVHGTASSMGSYPDRVSQHYLLLQCAEKVCIHSLLQYKWPEHWLAFTAVQFFQVSRSLVAEVEHIAWMERYPGIEPVCIIRHSSGLRKCIHSLTQHNWPEDWLAITTILFFQVSRSLVVYGRAYSMGGTVSRRRLLALCATAVCSESVYSWSAAV